MFRTMHSKTVLYCGYWFKPVELDYLCDMHNKAKSCGGPINNLPYEEPKDNKRPVFVIERNGKKLNFESVTAAADFLSVPVSTLCNSLARGCRSKGRQVGYIE
jgi:hypothetical protein